MSAGDTLLRIAIALAWILAIISGLIGVVLAIVPILIIIGAVDTWRSWRPA